MGEAMRYEFTTQNTNRLIRIGSLTLGLAVLGLAGCTSDMKMGQGGSVVTGSAGDAGAQGASSTLVRCTSKAGTIAVAENPHGYSYAAYYGSLPRSPLPLLKLMLQQTGCFTVVDRGAGLAATRAELQLQREGLTRKQDNVTRGNVVEAHFTLIPDVIFTENNAGGMGGALTAFIPRAPLVGAIAGGMKFKEAQVVLTLTDNNTTEQVAAAEGSAKATDFGIGGGIIGVLGAAAVGGWGNTNEGKVVAAAMMDGINKIVPQIQSMGPAGEIPAKRR
jgi:curli biogenesis system outer membrane secretion channel CsgG